MDIASLQFVALGLAAALLFHLFANPIYRKAVLTGVNLIFIASYITSVEQVLPIAFFLLFGYGMIDLVRRRRSGAALTLALVATIALYIFLKKVSFLGLPTLPFVYLVIGISYMLFRMLHLMVDAASEHWDRPLNPWSYFNYTCGFLTLVSGPIQRYQDFLEGEEKIAAPLNQESVDRSFERVINGFVKVLVVSATANYLFLQLASHVLDLQWEVLSWSELCIYYFCAAAAYTAYLYYNFAGHMDIVIGMGRLFNWDLPENFNKPFAARSFLEFWNRWHMTLSGWFKIYLFTPLMLFLTARFPSPTTLPYLGVFGFFFTFFVVGIWHGTTPIFLLCGMLMGAGASINKLWQLRMQKSLSRKKYQELCKRPAYIYLCRGLTFSYFTMAVATCFWVDLSQMVTLVGTAGAVGVSGIFVAMTLAAALGAIVWDLSAAVCRKIFARLAAFENLVTRNMWLATLIVLIVIVSSFYHKAPDFVYRAF